MRFQIKKKFRLEKWVPTKIFFFFFFFLFHFRKKKFGKNWKFKEFFFEKTKKKVEVRLAKAPRGVARVLLSGGAGWQLRPPHGPPQDLGGPPSPPPPETQTDFTIHYWSSMHAFPSARFSGNLFKFYLYFLKCFS